MAYQFHTQLNLGKQIEYQLDEFFSKWYKIEEVSIQVECETDIDRIFTSPKDGKVSKVSYKADWKAFQTGNVFLEKLVVGLGDYHYHKQGWLNHSQADYILYALCEDDRAVQVLILDPLKLRDDFNMLDMFPVRECYNEKIKSVGYIVPIDKILPYTKGVLNVN